jgi:hypothetical protein
MYSAFASNIQTTAFSSFAGMDGGLGCPHGSPVSIGRRRSEQEPGEDVVDTERDDMDF